VTYVLDEAGYRQALLDKLAEEAAEATRALTAATGMSWDQLLMPADDKRHHRSGFEDKIFPEAIE
jgi:hypothetical protein